MEDFLSTFHRYFGQCRSAESLLTYASLPGQTTLTLKELGKWIHSVLTDTFLAERYSSDNSPHLKRLYNIDPQLKKALPSLCDEIGKRSVASLTDGYAPKSFPLDRAALEQKIVKDRHIVNAESRFPHLWNFLTKNGEEKELLSSLQKAFRNAERRRAKMQKKEKDDAVNPALEMAETRLQQLLIQLCLPANACDIKREKILRKVNEQIIQLKNFGKEVGEEFSFDVKTALQLVQEEKRHLGMAQCEVFLTHNYWDLFRIGSDVPSCQRADGDFIYNKCLMGYVLDGRTFPIVVKWPGSEAIIARRLLRIEIESESQSPALYLENLYSNSLEGEIDQAIVALAKKVANHLNYPLYCNSLPGKATTLTLNSLGNGGRWVYSDASHGVTEGIFSISNPKELYRPVEGYLNSHDFF